MVTGEGMPAAMTVDEAVEWFDPPISRRQLADLITTLKIRPVGKRPRPIGRPALEYDAAELMRLHASLVPWLTEAVPSGV